MLQAPAVVPEPDIREAVERAFHGKSQAPQPWLSRLWEYIYELWTRFWHQVGLGERTIHASRPVEALILVIVLVAVVAVLARTMWVWRARGDVVGPGGIAGGSLLRGDPWAQAQALAAAGDYTAAAHALYATLLEHAARRQQVRLHPSKTLGDYARELRARRSRLASGFRDFAADYESVIYGEQQCDADRYGRLFALATPMLRADG